MLLLDNLTGWDVGVVRELAYAQVIVEQDLGTALLLQHVMPMAVRDMTTDFSSRQPDSDKIQLSRVRLL
jgi:hypothetical protein